MKSSIDSISSITSWWSSWNTIPMSRMVNCGLVSRASALCLTKKTA